MRTACPNDHHDDNNNGDKEALLKFMQDADCLDSLSKWTNELNMFDILKISRTEIRHSNMLGWLLDPNENHGLGDSFLYGIVSRLSQHTDSQTALQFLSSDFYSFNVYREWNHIDILIISHQCKLVIAIENKVGSHEHNSSYSEESQLITYKKKILSQYSDYRKLFVYLTPDGERPSDDDWITFNYSDVVAVLENVYGNKINLLGPEVSLLIKNYINNIKRNVIMDQELINLCNSIYNKHRRALDLIFDNRDDVISQISNNCKSILSTTPGIILDDSSKSKIYVKFRTKGLMDSFKDIGLQYYYYQFEIKEDHVTIMLEYHKEKTEVLDDEVWDTMMKVRGKFPKKRKEPAPDGNWVWYRVWTEKTEKINDENWISEKIQKILKSDGSFIILQQDEKGKPEQTDKSM